MPLPLTLLERLHVLRGERDANAVLSRGFAGLLLLERYASSLKVPRLRRLRLRTLTMST